MNFFELLRFIAITIINGILELFPTADPAILSKINSQIAPLKTYMYAAGWFFPVQTALQLIGIIFTIEASIFLFHFVKFIAKNVSLGFIRD